MLDKNDPINVYIKNKEDAKAKRAETFKQQEMKIKKEKEQAVWELKKEGRKVIGNKSVFNLMSLKSLTIVFILLGGLSFFVSLIVASCNNKDSNLTAVYILSIVACFALTLLLIFIAHHSFSYFINKRNENIDYMNERLEYCEKELKSKDKK